MGSCGGGGGLLCCLGSLIANLTLLGDGGLSVVLPLLSTDAVVSGVILYLNKYA